MGEWMMLLCLLGVAAAGWIAGSGVATVRASHSQSVARGRELKVRIALAELAAASQKVLVEGEVQVIAWFDDGQDLRGPLRDATDKARDVLKLDAGPLFTHQVRGSCYEVLSEQVHLNTAGRPPLRDQDLLTLYTDVSTGRLCVRHSVEFHDGRFTRGGCWLGAQAGEGAAPGRAYVDPDADLLRAVDRAG